jgi:hypothetical protein
VAYEEVAEYLLMDVAFDDVVRALQGLLFASTAA